MLNLRMIRVSYYYSIRCQVLDFAVHAWHHIGHSYVVHMIYFVSYNRSRQILRSITLFLLLSPHRQSHRIRQGLPAPFLQFASDTQVGSIAVYRLGLHIPRYVCTYVDLSRDLGVTVRCVRMFVWCVCVWGA